MLRLIVHKARTHFNNALEFADRNRDQEAIAELHHALDLDYSHLPSHVVLGSLYARQGETDRAEECWREALKLDPQVEKAHTYLSKMDSVRRSLPIVHRQRILIGFLLVVLIAFGTLLWKFNAPNPHQHRLQQAWDLYQMGKYAAALELVAQAADAKEPDLYATSTLLLGDLIQAEQQIALKAVRIHIESQDYLTAARQARELLNRMPPATVRVELERALAQTRQMARNAVHRAVGDYEAGTTSEAGVQAVIAAYGETAGQEAEQEMIREVNERIGEIRKNREIQQALARNREPGADPWQALEQLGALTRKYPEDPRPQRAFEAIAEPMRAKHTAIIEEHLRAGNLAAAAEALKPLGQVLKYTDPDTATERIRAFEQRIAEAQSTLTQQEQRRRIEQLDARLREARESGDLERIVEAAQQLLEADGLDETARAVARQVLEQTHPRLADARWRWMVARGRDFIDSRISIETAEQTIRWYPQVQEHLPRQIYPRSHDNLLFFLAMAYRRLGRTEDYHNAIARILREFPDTDYMRWVRHYIQRDNLKISD